MNKLNKNTISPIIDYLKNPSIGEVEDYMRRRSIWIALNIDEKKHLKVNKTEKSLNKIDNLKNIDNACIDLEKKLLSYNKTFSKSLAKHKSTPDEIKSFYNEWSNLKKKRKFSSKDIGEEIVALYYEVQNIKYERNLKVPSVRTIKFDSSKNNKKYHEPDGLEENKFYVEVKMRAYQSSGTANEKIPSVAFKYADLPKKIKLFLLADDEHKYNVYWSKLIRGDMLSTNKYNSEFETQYVKIHKFIIEKIVYGSEVAEALEKKFLQNT